MKGKGIIMKKTRILCVVLAIVFILSTFSISTLSANSVSTITGTIQIGDADAVHQKNSFNLANIQISVFSASLQEVDIETGIEYYAENYAFTVSSDENGVFMFDAPSEYFSVSPVLSSLPYGYGVDTANYFMSNDLKTISLFIYRVHDVRLDNDFDDSITIFNKYNDPIYASYSIQNNCNVTKNEILYSDKIEIRDTVLIYGVTYDVLNECDISSLSRQERINIAYDTGLISETEFIDLYADLILNRTGETDCLTDIVWILFEYKERKDVYINKETQEKLDTIFTRPNESSNRTIPNYNSEATVSDGEISLILPYQGSGLIAVSLSLPENLPINLPLGKLFHFGYINAIVTPEEAPAKEPDGPDTDTENEPTAPVITSADCFEADSSTGGMFQVTADGTEPIVFSLTGEPAGISIDAESGLITVAALMEAGTYSFTVTAGNGRPPDAVQYFTLIITESLIVPFIPGSDSEDGAANEEGEYEDENDAENGADDEYEPYFEGEPAVEEEPPVEADSPVETEPEAKTIQPAETEPSAETVLGQVIHYAESTNFPVRFLYLLK
jgi:hypothetical protein